MVFKQENPAGYPQEWYKMSDSQKEKYQEKAKKNRAKHRVLMKEYKQTPQYKKWNQKRRKWEESITKFFPPQPNGGVGDKVWCFHFIGIIYL